MLEACCRGFGDVVAAAQHEGGCLDQGGWQVLEACVGVGVVVAAAQEEGGA